jgi:hypothetical protein
MRWRMSVTGAIDECELATVFVWDFLLKATFFYRNLTACPRFFFQ